MGACGCRSRAQQRAKQALQAAVVSGVPSELQYALDQAQAAKLHQGCKDIRIARAAKARADNLSASMTQLLLAATATDDLALVESALLCASAASIDDCCEEMTAAETCRVRLRAIAALHAAASSGVLAEIEQALADAAMLHIEEDCKAVQVAKLAQVYAVLRTVAATGSLMEIQHAMEQARLAGIDDDSAEMHAADAALTEIGQKDAKDALQHASESGELWLLEAALRQARAAEVDETCQEMIAAKEAHLVHTPVLLVVKGLASVDSAAVLKMAKPRDLPEEMLLQQEIMSVPGGIDCFHCGGSGNLFTRRKRRLEEAISMARAGVDIADAQIAVEEQAMIAPSTRFGVEVLNADIGDVGLANIGMDDVVLDIQNSQMDQQHSDANSTIPAEKAMWLFEDGVGGWGIYDEIMAAQLEEAWWDGAGAILQVRGARFTYEVDLDSMVQQNIQTGKERRVQRLALDEDVDVENVHEPFTNEVVEAPSMSPSEGSTHGASSVGHPLDNDSAVATDAATLERSAGCSSLESVDEPFSKTLSIDQEHQVEVVVGTGPALGSNHDAEQVDTAASEEAAPKDIQPTRQCWVCRGTGKTSKWLSGFQPSQLNSSEDRPCLVCYGDSQYGLSMECDHYYCRVCIVLCLEAIMSSGQFPAFCPQCRATAEGRRPNVGRIEDVALSFLVQREVISNDFFFRFSRQQQASEVPGAEPAFECPAHCGRFLLQDDPSYEHRFGAPVAVGRTRTLRLGECPCGVRVCALCHQQVEGSSHLCPEEERPEMPSDPETLKLLGLIGKKCPKCGIFIQKNEGCQKMTCGTTAHGKLVDILKNGGCGCGFEWSTLKVIDDTYTDLDDVRKSGRLITARQFPGHPKCARAECRFFKTVDDLLEPRGSSKQAKNGGGEYCCDMCKQGPSGSHSPLCHQIRFYLPPLPPAPT